MIVNLLSLAFFVFLPSDTFGNTFPKPDDSPRCTPESSQTSACVWTGDCPVGGCGNRCILNEDLTSSWSVVRDRGVAEDAFEACPLLSYWLNIMIAINKGGSRRRLQSDSASAEDFLRRALAARPTPRQMQGMAGGIPAIGNSGWLTDSHALDVQHRRLLDFLADAPAPGLAMEDDLPSNACPTAEDMDAVAFLMFVSADRWREIFTIDAEGKEMPAELQDFVWVLQQPNRYQFLTTMFEDPDQTVEYVSTKCMTELVQSPESIFYEVWLEDEEATKLDKASGSKMLQCVDNFGAYDSLAVSYKNLVDACSPPFEETPDCFSERGYDVISSPACAQAYRSMFNVSDVSTLARVAEITAAIHPACSAVTTQEDCMAAKTPAVAEIKALHDSIPVRYKLDVEAQAPAVVVEAVTVCFNPPCETEAPQGGPGAATEGPAMAPVLPPTSTEPAMQGPVAPVGVDENPRVTAEDVQTSGSRPTCFMPSARSAAAAGALMSALMLR